MTKSKLLPTLKPDIANNDSVSLPQEGHLGQFDGRPETVPSEGTVEGLKAYGADRPPHIAALQKTLCLQYKRTSLPSTASISGAG